MPNSHIHTLFPNATWTSTVYEGAVIHRGTLPRPCYEVRISITSVGTVAIYDGQDGMISMTRRHYVDAIHDLRDKMPQTPPWENEAPTTELQLTLI